MREIVVDGERFVRACDSGPIKIVVLDRGFIYIGRVDESDESGGPVVTIHDARCIIRWGGTQHLGELVNGPLAKTKLGSPCTVQARVPQIIHMIEVSQDGWHKHIG